MRDITTALVRELFRYEDGKLYWRIQSNGRVPAGQRAGSYATYGCRVVQIDGRKIREHRIIWIYHYGTHQTEMLDHINGKPADNRIENLRPASRSQNVAAALKTRTDQTSGMRGVFWNKRNGKWHAQIGVNKKRLHLGLFDDILEAAAAYDAAARKYFGEFAYQNLKRAA